MTAGQPPSTHSHRVGSTTRPSARVTASRTSFSVCRYGLASRSGVVQALTSSRCAATQSGPGPERYGVSFKNTIDRAAPCSWFMVEAIPAPQFDEVWPLIAKAPPTTTMSGRSCLISASTAFRHASHSGYGWLSTVLNTVIDAGGHADFVR